jgi:hypothetical protein
VPTVVVEGIPPWDGRYDFEDWSFTNRELYRIKEVSKGLRAAELIDALDANDPPAFIAVAVVVLGRHGKIVADPDVEDFWDAKIGCITIDLADVANGNGVPPTQPPSDAEQSGNEPSSGEPSVSDGG